MVSGVLFVLYRGGMVEPPSEKEAVVLQLLNFLADNTVYRVCDVLYKRGGGVSLKNLLSFLGREVNLAAIRRTPAVTAPSTVLSILPVPVTATAGGVDRKRCR